MTEIKGRKRNAPLLDDLLDGRPRGTESAVAHPAPALDAAGAAHADPLPLAKASMMDPTLGPSATARRDERVVAGGAFVLAAETEPARPLLGLVRVGTARGRYRRAQL